MLSSDEMTKDRASPTCPASLRKCPVNLGLDMYFQFINNIIFSQMKSIHAEMSSADHVSKGSIL